MVNVLDVQTSPFFLSMGLSFVQCIFASPSHAQENFQHRRNYRADVTRDSYKRALDFPLAGLLRTLLSPLAALALTFARQPRVRRFLRCTTLCLGALCELVHLRQNSADKRQRLEHRVQESLVLRD